jgi:23S rRNA (cytidine2498-2'-O)-methyltransferase
MIACLAPDGFLQELRTELGGRTREVHGRLVIADAGEEAIAWAANIWRTPRQIPIASIGDAAKQLRAIQRNWALHSIDHHRRASLILEKLPKVSARPLAFPEPVPVAPLGSFALLKPDLMLASPDCSSPFPNGEARFVEDRDGPPSRAYLKLWEALTIARLHPAPGDLCLDLGSAPGGWTWALARLGARVISLDKAELDPGVAAMPGVEHRRESAFSLDPRNAEPVDWLFSDVICYPARLIGLIERWIASGKARRIVCSVKFQGATDFGAIAALKLIPGARLVHLHHNKHELTFMRL